MGEFRATLGRLSAGESLTMAEMSYAIDKIMEGGVSEEQIGLLLTSLVAKGETGEEVAGAAAAMRRKMTPIKSSQGGIVDTCGTGGGGS